MNAKNTLATLNSEYTKVVNELRKESSPRKFKLVPSKEPGTTDEYYYRVTYAAYERYNNAQRAKVNHLNSVANDLYASMCRIKGMNAIKRFFIA